MKSILGALALVIAAPVVAQETPAADPHAGHSQHQEQGSQQPLGHTGDEEHKKDCCKNCCDKMKRQEKPMECCEEHGETSTDAPADQSQHNH